MYRHLQLLALTLALAAPAIHAADRFQQASQAACSHVRQCALGDVSDLEPQMRASLEQSFGDLCSLLPGSSSAEAPGFGPQHPLYAPATACMHSITGLACGQIEASADTAECRELESLRASSPSTARQVASNKHR